MQPALDARALHPPLRVPLRRLRRQLSFLPIFPERPRARAGGNRSRACGRHRDPTGSGAACRTHRRSARCEPRSAGGKHRGSGAPRARYPVTWGFWPLLLMSSAAAVECEPSKIPAQKLSERPFRHDEGVTAQPSLVVVRVLARGKLREPFGGRRFLRRLPRQAREPKEGRQAAFDAVLVDGIDATRLV